MIRLKPKFKVTLKKDNPAPITGKYARVQQKKKMV